MPLARYIDDITRFCDDDDDDNRARVDFLFRGAMSISRLFMAS